MKLQYKKPTDRVKGHTEVWYENELIGYFLPNRSKAREEGENWNFVSHKLNKGIEHCHASNRDALIQKIEEQL